MPYPANVALSVSNNKLTAITAARGVFTLLFFSKTKQAPPDWIGFFEPAFPLFLLIVKTDRKSLPVFEYIQLDAELAETINAFDGISTISFDLEFDRDRHTYGFDLCLVQIGANNNCLIVDPLTLKDLQPVFGVFESPHLKKLVHSPGEDLRLLHSLGCYPKSLVDTEVIAKLLNYEHTSLARILELKLGISLNKKQQQSNWHLRPLTEGQLKYAADDVLHLPELFNILSEEADAKGLTPFLEEESLWLETVKYTLEPKTNFLKPGDLKNLSDWQQYVLNETFKLRDKIAGIKNKPAFMIMPEPTVRDIALGYADYRDTGKLTGLHPSIRHGNTAKEFADNMAQIFRQANALKLNKRVTRVYFTEEEMQANRVKRDWQRKLKDDIIEPVQKALIARLGEFATRYIMSNGWVTKWLNGEVQWADLQPAYKKRLIYETGTTLGLEMALLQEYEESFKKTA